MIAAQLILIEKLAGHELVEALVVEAEPSPDSRRIWADDFDPHGPDLAFAVTGDLSEVLARQGLSGDRQTPIRSRRTGVSGS